MTNIRVAYFASNFREDCLSRKPSNEAYCQECGDCIKNSLQKNILTLQYTKISYLTLMKLFLNKVRFRIFFKIHFFKDKNHFLALFRINKNIGNKGNNSLETYRAKN